MHFDHCILVLNRSVDILLLSNTHSHIKHSLDEQYVDLVYTTSRSGVLFPSSGQTLYKNACIISLYEEFKVSLRALAAKGNVITNLGPCWSAFFPPVFSLHREHLGSVS